MITRPDKISRRVVARQLHAWAVTRSRQSDLYINMGVPDTVAGRFEMLLLHVCLLVRRVRRAGPAGVDLGQFLFDTFVSDLDGALREMGVGDLAVPKQMQGMTKMFYGRAEALGTALLAADPAPALRDADIVYTDVWTSMGQEAEQQRRREDFGHLQVNDTLVALAPAGVRVMHCLPAHRGEEITDAVLDGARSIVFEQAENRLWTQMALLVMVFDGVPVRAGRATGVVG